MTEVSSAFDTRNENIPNSAQHERRVRRLRRTHIKSLNELKPSQHKQSEINLSAFTGASSHFEKYSCAFVAQRRPTISFHKTKSMNRLTSITERLRTSVNEIQRGFRQQDNYRVIYECLKVSTSLLFSTHLVHS